MEYVPNKEVIVKRIARFFQNGNVVNLGIGMPTEVANYIPSGVNIVLQSENGFLGLGKAAEKGKEDKDLINAGGGYVTINPGGCFFDSAASFGIIRGGHVDFTVLGALEVDQEGNLANYKIPGKLVPGMGGAMDLTVGARTVIIATFHFERGTSKLVRKCTLPLTAKEEVNFVVSDLGVFEVKDKKFILQECFKPFTPEYIMQNTQADICIASDMKEIEIQ